jgi:type IX secretion system PorP/SprF family membrane protein
MGTYFRKSKTAGAALLLILGVFTAPQLAAQLNPLSSIYYQNQYLSNPAMAGMEDHFKLNLALRKQYSGMPGAPVTQSFSADGGLGERVGLGLHLHNDKAGLLQYTRVMGTYAYHLPLSNESEKLSFGVSLGFMNERLNEADVNGDAGDDRIGQFNKRETFIDGDFGMAYTSEKLTIQGALPNLKSFFSADDVNSVDYSLFFTAVSYKFHIHQPSNNDLIVEPKVALRGVKGYKNSYDVGANVTITEHGLSLMGLWHSSQSATFGMGLNLNKTFNLMGVYTTETGRLSRYTNGDLEIALRVNLF